ncbi:unnamed protein product [Urochloa decumbens]|uniref:WRKY domain-containing protein n=1 Tax=Urochloa decumbens TaxID=240449 RepID=A0ABC9FGK6_9POAL
MESVVIDGGNGGGERVVTELSQIMELVRQLQGYLGGSQTQEEECRRLASQISSLTERSITLITCLDSGGRKRSAASPLSDANDAPFKTTKKRRSANKVKNQVRVSAASGGGGGDIPADDGHSWRKYGQKEILGAKYPRGYYRCTHRHSQGCAATKQVQRADEDPTLFDIVYLGDHTCVQNGAAAAGQPTPAAEHNPNAHGLLQSLSSNLTVKTEGPQGWVGAAAAAAPFCLPSTPASACLQAAVAAELSPFSAPSTTSENWGVSPATSDSNNQHAAASSFPPFEVVAGGDLQFEFGEVVSALADVPDDFDISSFFA